MRKVRVTSSNELKTGSRDWAESARHYWNSVAFGYDSLYANRWSLMENHQVSQNLRSLSIPRNARVLDICCGTGLGADLLRQIHAEMTYVGLDISENALAELRKQRRENVVIADTSSDLPFADDSFDAVVGLFSAGSYSYNWKAMIQEAGRVLVNGGILYISVLNRLSLRRLISLRFRKIENYSTRGSTHAGMATPAWTFTQSEASSALKNSGFSSIRPHPISVLGGVFEHEAAWGLDRALCRLTPWLAHLTDWSGVKAG